MHLLLKSPDVFSIPFFLRPAPQPSWACLGWEGEAYPSTALARSPAAGPPGLIQGDPGCQGKACGLSPASTGCRKHRHHLKAETELVVRPHSICGLDSGTARVVLGEAPGTVECALSKTCCRGRSGLLRRVLCVQVGDTHCLREGLKEPPSRGLLAGQRVPPLPLSSISFPGGLAFTQGTWPLPWTWCPGSPGPNVAPRGHGVCR